MFKRSARIGSYTVKKTTRETATITSPSVGVLISIETLADGQSVCIYPLDCLIEHGDEDMPIDHYVSVAMQGLRKLGYEVEVAD